jgi:NitT/TauT family transport system substrate-binding protein
MTKLTLTRRSVVVPLALFLFPSHLYAADGTPSTNLVTVRFAATLSTTALPMLYAVANGLFAKRGLDVKIIQYADFDGVYTAARSGAADIVSGGPAAIANLRNNGVSFKVARGTSLFLNDILVKRNSSIKLVSELKGKRIGIFGGPAGNAANVFMALMTQQYGFDPRTSGKVVYGASGLLTELLAKGELDACISNDPITSEQISSGRAVSIGELGDLYASHHDGYHPFAGAFSESDEFARQHPDVMNKFSQAWVETVKTFSQNDDLWISGLKRYLKIDDDASAALMRDRLKGNYPLEWTQSNVIREIEVLKFVKAGAGKGFLDKIPADLFVTPTE